jgi:hypothetical protein
VHLHRVGHVGDLPGDAQALRQSRGLAKTPRFRHRRRRDVAHRDIAGLRDQLADEFPSHSRAAAGDDRDPAREILYVSRLPWVWSSILDGQTAVADAAISDSRGSVTSAGPPTVRPRINFAGERLAMAAGAPRMRGLDAVGTVSG